jgi:hypothetical protein
MAFDLHWGDFSGLSERDLDILHTLIQSAVRKVFFPLRPGTGRLHEWSWTSPLRTLIVRSLITGTLSAIPARAGGTIILTANEAIFDSDLVGHDLTFDSSGQRYTIVEFVRDAVVRVIGAVRGSGQETLLGEKQAVVIETAVLDVTTTTITESSSKSFYADMIGDKAVFAGGGSYTIERVDTANNQITVAGDASAETGALTIERSVFGGTSTANITGGGRILAPGGTFRQDMEDDGDTVSVVSATVYTIYRFENSGRVLTTPAFAAADLFDGTNPQTLTIKKSFATDYTVVADQGEWVIRIFTPGVFVADDVGRFLVFSPWNDLGTHKIVQFIDSQNVRVLVGARPIRAQEGGFIVRVAGRLDSATPRTFDGVTTLLTATSALFTSAMVGLVMEFPFPEVPPRKYVITEVISGNAAVRVAGDATREGSNDNFLVVGPSDLAANDAFTVLNTGADYEMPEDFGGLDGPITFASDSWSSTVEITTETNIRRARQRLSGDGRPQLAALRPQIHDGKFTQRYDLLLWPTPDGKYTLEYRQIVVLPEIDEANPFPPGGAVYGELYLSACLALAQERIDDKRGLRWQEFQERLAAMIEVDAIAVGAEHLGRGYEEGSQGVRFLPKTQDVVYVPG